MSAVRPAPPPATSEIPESTSSRIVERWRNLAVALALAALAIAQDPGRIAADTKLDLAINPAGLLSRALNLWEPLGFGGQVQNQGYGYLFPMGPFFLIGDLMGAPAWLWQRLWWAIVLFAAYLGMYLLARALGVGTPGTRLIGALAFALAPRMIATIGPISSEALAMAVAPWVLLPLVVAARDGRLARGGLLAGVALLFAGGVNAAATLVLCIPPALFLLTRAGGPGRRRLAGWWALATVLACAWWMGPLVILRAVSPPFLDYIEDAAVTTRFASLPQAVRGTEHWLGFLVDVDGPTWSAGWLLVSVPIVIAYTAMVAAFGLAGLSLRSMPQRTFVIVLALTGVVLVTFGYMGSVSSPLAEWTRGLLDGPLVAFRNTHKFDPVLRMALALGLMHFVARAIAFARGREGWRVVPYAVSALAILGVAGTAFPAYIGQLAPRGSFVDVPGYWQEAVDFLEEGTAEGGRALLVPGTSFGTYLWGTPRDEPIQALGHVPWVVRDAIPLTPPATIRMLDALQARFASGRSAPGLADQLAASGVRYLVIRNDLNTSGLRAPSPTVVHEALRGTLGLQLVADFGPLVGGQLDDGAVVDRGLSQPYRAIEIYEVEPFPGLVSVAPLARVPVVVGGPENVVDLRDSGLLDAAPALLDGDRTAGAVGPIIQTDGIARRESTPGRVDDNVSARLTADEDGVLGRRALDYTVFPDDRALAPARWVGDGRITASSSAADVESPGGARRAASPAAGLDGDLFSSWWSAEGGDEAPWWEVEWPNARALPALRIAVDLSTPAPRAEAIEVSTADGSAAYEVPPDGIVEVPASPTPTTYLRIGSADAPGDSLGIREVLGLPSERRTAVAPEPSRPPTVTALSAAVDGRPWCLHPPSAVICTDLIGRTGEEDGAIDRIAAVPASDPLPTEASAVPLPGGPLDALIRQADESTGALMTATASTSVVPDPEGGPRAAIDRDLETAWIADSSDDDPRLALDWREERTVTGLRLRQRLGLPASRPLTAAVQFPDGETRSGRFDEAGVLLFDEPVRASSMVIRFPQVQEVFSVDPASAGGVILPVGVADLRILGAADLQPDPAADVAVDVPCGQGPAVAIGDALVNTVGRTTVRDLVQRLPITFDACGPVRAQAADGGAARILATGGDRWSVRQVVLGATAAIDSTPQEPVEVLSWGPATRSVRVPAREAATLLVVRENANPGWAATLDGRPLESARPDGWQQGWVVPAGASGVVEMRMTLGPVYQAALLAGAACVIVLFGLVVFVSRRSRGEVGAPVAEADVPQGVQWTIVAAALVAAAGVWGAMATAVAWGAKQWLPVKARPAVPICVFALALVTGAVLALGTWPWEYAGDSLAAALPVTLALALAASPDRDRRARDASPASPGSDSSPPPGAG